MARLPYISREDLTEDKTHIYDRIAETRKGDIQAKGMPRIFQLLLNNPEAAAPVAALGEYIRFSSNLDPVVREIAILSTAREMSSQKKWQIMVMLTRTRLMLWSIYWVRTIRSICLCSLPTMRCLVS